MSASPPGASYVSRLLMPTLRFSTMSRRPQPYEPTTPSGVWELTKPTATERREVVIGFEAGVPVSADRVAMPLHELIVHLNRYQFR